MIDEVFRPDGTLLERLVDNLDGTGTRTTFDAEGNETEVENLTGLPVPEPVPLTESQLIAKLVLAPQVRDDEVELSDDEVAEMAPLFPEWRPGIQVAVGDVLRWDGTLVECIQAHPTQSDWTPDVTPALWKVHRTPDMTEWTAGIDVEVGEEFTYQGTTYRVLQAHPTQVGWEPPNAPALWELVA